MHSSCFIYLVDPSLVQVNYKDHVVSETAKSVHGGHRNDETKQVVYYSVEELVEKRIFWHVFYRFESIVNVQLRRHLYESEEINSTNQSVKNK
jgi:hypothetical protein